MSCVVEFPGWRESAEGFRITGSVQRLGVQGFNDLGSRV